MTDDALAPGGAPGVPPTYFAPVGEISGTSVALKWGTIFGLLAAALNVGQTAIGALVVNAQAAAVDRYVAGVQAFDQCIQLGNDPSSCTVPQPDPGIAAIPLVFYSTCFLAFALTLPIYLAAGRSGARAAARKMPGILAAGVAAIVSCASYAGMQVLVTNATGRSAMLFGLSALQTTGASGMSGFLSGTVQAQVCAFPLTIGFALVLGNWGAAIGMRQVDASLERMLAAGPGMAFAPPGMALSYGPAVAGPVPTWAGMPGTGGPYPGVTAFPGPIPGAPVAGPAMGQSPYGGMPSPPAPAGGYPAAGYPAGGYQVAYPGMPGPYGAPIITPRVVDPASQRYVPNAAPPPGFPMAAREYTAPPSAAPRYVAPEPTPSPDAEDPPDSLEGVAPPDALPPDALPPTTESDE